MPLQSPNKAIHATCKDPRAFTLVSDAASYKRVHKAIYRAGVDVESTSRALPPRLHDQGA
jgi:hypothetical protein